MVPEMKRVPHIAKENKIQVYGNDTTYMFSSKLCTAPIWKYNIISSSLLGPKSENYFPNIALGEPSSEGLQCLRGQLATSFFRTCGGQ